jgi:hypothetical protein
MKLHNSMPATGSAASKTYAAAIARARYFLYELSHWSAGKLYKTGHYAERRRVQRFQISTDLKDS